MTYTGEQNLLAKHANGTLIKARVAEDGSTVLIFEDGRKLTFTPEQIEEIKAEAEAKATAEIKARKAAEKADKQKAEQTKKEEK